MCGLQLKNMAVNMKTYTQICSFVPVLQVVINPSYSLRLIIINKNYMLLSGIKARKTNDYVLTDTAVWRHEFSLKLTAMIPEDYIVLFLFNKITIKPDRLKINTLRLAL